MVENVDRATRSGVPRATYRLQLNAQFTLRHATAVVPYLADLGISHVYCSPYFRARPGSLHGYDVVDHNALNPEIGSRADLEAFIAALRSRQMGHILDFVPNHVGIFGAENAWWMDVLENGKASRYAAYFDIDWSPPNLALHNKILVPALGDSYGTELERGDLKLCYEPAFGSFAIVYHRHRLPIDPATYPRILENLKAHLAQCDEETQRRFVTLVAALRAIPGRDVETANERAARSRATEECKRKLRELTANDRSLSNAISATAAAFSDPIYAEATEFEALHGLLEQQAFHLASWRVASDDINYRRFFDVNDLAALRMENDAVFEAIHHLVFQLIRSGKLDGLRIDHPDGLYDPAAYFERLQLAAGSSARNPRPLYLVAEKITASFEHLPTTWQVHGTTGYNFAVAVNGLFVDTRAKGRMDRAYRTFVGGSDEWADIAIDSKILVMRTSLAAELTVLSNQLANIAQTNRHTRDFTVASLRHALVEVIACFPVYRTYVTDTASDEDRHYIDWAIGRARRRSSATDASLFSFLRSIMLADTHGFTDDVHARIRAFACKLQQVTSPVTAKGVEDTALYRFTRLASLNEVGGDPERFGMTVGQFHKDSARRALQWPHEMLATSTHDTKRSEDVRARLNVLSEMPGRWYRLIVRWSRINRSRRRIVDDLAAPGPHAEYLLYQTLVGTWPAFRLQSDEDFKSYEERIQTYMLKASREAKRRTSWTNPNAEYEEALSQFIAASLEPRETNPFVVELAAFACEIAPFGYYNGLSQTICKLTAPGVPDIYQGTELWDDSLVDPDNRRPVDYDHRRKSLDQMRTPAASGADRGIDGLLGDLSDGRIKLYVVQATLQFRRQHDQLFTEGEYLPLRVTGERALHVCAFARVRERQFAVSIFPRLLTKLLRHGAPSPIGEAIWGDTKIELPKNFAGDRLTDAFAGGVVESHRTAGKSHVLVANVLRKLPVGLLSV